MSEKNKNIIAGAVVLIIVFGGLVWLARPNSGFRGASSGASNKGAAVALVANESAFDFGTISMAAGNVTHLYKIKNTSSQDAVITRVYTSCMCTSAYLLRGDKRFGPYGMPGHAFGGGLNEILKPNEEASIEAIFDPAAHGPAGVGAIQRAVVIETDSGKTLELNFSAMVTP